MMVIGLGKHTGASTMHSYGVNHFNRLIPEVTRVLMKQTNVILGVGIIEDALEQVCDVCVIPIEDVLQREPELLKIAKEKMARIPFDSIDVLVIDEIGKDISGAGMDPNVTGRAPSGVLKDHCPRVQKIVVRDLTPNSHGNAVGIGMADVITKRVLEKIDFSSTYTNAITSTSLSAAKIPIVCPNDREALAVAVKTCNGVSEGDLKIVWIRNTLQLRQLYVSEAYLDLIHDRTDLEIKGDPDFIHFDQDGHAIRLAFESPH
ncbi:hypothetical protein LLE49_03575 [Alicyclobacillus tolerans]|uniref:hypothetical protein n=1 Tax=Alicyclobacillus tolerans TaxID=90970 RepID=UPI001F41A207|nr:hypothetical protein [Alicyclobacillus tolerans]MCF8563819.1 hypothetical protein [Alicyclobacillus tolerans]